ncbi:uncharacterized protein PADG_02659 [Paracoccidioides brasiliensis Pb18]|uniref:THO complex subunit 2 n=1 Tax=Paracoccidioides brasiliensis (strain Pb18) TaxID=502780 RepID=C1G654_PARBD|nr:uncharacterized protein PADG_02659 [Paracoccidioides brasiliensis Pb18]EEH46561.1 hypothetical protein PADG_02659 [Paracoccidioides brasiliensis Pb18]
MPSAAGGKRKRGDRSWSGDAGNDGWRPSPHRPGNLNLAQQHQQNQFNGQSRDSTDNRNRGGRRTSRGGNRNGTPARRASEGHNSHQKENSPSLRSAMISQRDPPELSQPSRMPSTPIPTSSSQPQVMFYSYEYLTRECVDAWTLTGRKAVIDIGVGARKAEDALVISSVFQEIIQSVIDGRISAVDGGTSVKEIIGEDVADDMPSVDGSTGTSQTFDVRSLFLDTLSVTADANTSHSSLRTLVFSTGISPTLMRQQLETPLLQSLGLIRDTFARMGIRKQTNLLYRQSNYNLLREESEGYSKLLTELFTTSSNEPPSGEVVEDTFERVKAMIGAFDMDVGRVLDVTLDVFAAVLVKKNRFFVKFLRVSSWWPKEESFLRRYGGISEPGLPKWALPGSAGWLTTEEDREEALRANEKRDRLFWDRAREVGIRAYFEIGRNQSLEPKQLKSISELKINAPEEDNDTLKWIEQSGTLPPKSNGVAAQLLGFKLRFYSSDARNPADILPDNLIYLAALLIKVGFISLRDLYPHLWRPDEFMDELKEEKMKEKEQRELAARPGAGAMNALMMAGALSDDTIPVPMSRLRETDTRAATPAKDQDVDKTAQTKVDEKKESLPEPADQKVLLLKSLLAIGALPESLYILGRFPWLLDAYPELPEYIHRIIHHSLSKLCDSSRPLSSRSDIKTEKKITSSDQAGLPRGNIRLTDPPPRRVLRWALLDKEDTNDGTDYRFYWDDWTDNIPVCQTVDDVFTLCGSFLNLSGVKIGQDPGLLTKLARLGNESLQSDPSESNQMRWRDLCKRLLVPALSLTRANPGVVNEVFELLSHFSRDVRYSIYAEWYSGQTSRLPDIKSAFDQARAETKDALKRLSKTNIKPMARNLAKIAFANPGIVISVAINQIEAYENLIEVVVECARYFTYLGYDILTWSLINSLGQKGRSRVQDGGLLTSRWLNALASFVGRVFKRYSTIMDPVPVLQYVGEQLRHNNSTDLVILEQLISSMAGIVTDTNFNDSQIQAMAGGALLQSQTMLQLLDKRHESKITSRRLIKSLANSKLAGQLLIAVAQERATCIFKESEADGELKLLGNIFDEIHRVLTQYIDLLRSNFTVEEFDSFVPDVASLIGEFGLQPEVAFWITRPSVAHQIAEVDTKKREQATKKQETETIPASKSPDGDLEMADDGEAVEKEDSSGDVTISTEESTSSTNDNQGEAKTNASITSSTSKADPESVPWHPVLEGLMDKIKTAMPRSSWEVVGLPFFVTFWQLSLYDIHVPQRAYEEELERLKKKIQAISQDRSDVSIAGTLKKDKEKKLINDLHDRILAENKAHVRCYGLNRARLQKEKDRWFVGLRGKHEALNIAVMEQCLLPRLLLSPIDAFYSFKMLKYLHSSGTPNFRTVGFLDQLFREQRLTAIIFQSTSKEADNFGRFLNEVLRDLTRWHADKAVYEKEAYGMKRDLPGFAMAVDQEGKPKSFLDYEDFRRIFYKWHRIFGACLKTCLSGGEYMHIRNAISVLKAVVQHFPAVNWIGRDMHTCVNNLKTMDPRDDVKIPAASLIGDLNRREKKWLLPQAFMIVSLPICNVEEYGANPPKNESLPSDKAKARTPQPQSTTPKSLNASAPDFKPSGSSTTVNDARPHGPGKLEVEDGEIEDAKMVGKLNNAAMKAKAARGDAQSLQVSDTSSAVETASTSKLDKVEQNNKTPVLQETEPAKVAEPATGHSQTPAQPSSQQPSTTQATLGDSQTPVSGHRSSSPAPSRVASRPPSESSHVPSIPKRPDVDCYPPQHSASVRPQANLPNRPEPPRPFRHPDERMSMRPPNMPDERRDARDNRHPDRSGRFGGQDRERPFEHALPIDSRSHGRPNERPGDRDRLDGHRIDREFPSRPLEDNFGRPGYRDARPSPRDQEWSDRMGRGRISQADAFQVRQDSDRSFREGDVHQYRAANVPDLHDRDHPSRPHTETGIHQRLELPRPERDDRRNRSSRPSTPPKADDSRLQNRSDRREEREERKPTNSQPPARSEDLPTGPKGDRGNYSSAADNRHALDSRSTYQSTTDSSYGRLNQDSKFPLRPQESFDRPQDIPSGPRKTSTQRGGRNPSLSQPLPIPPQPTDRQPPTGPSNRPLARNPAQHDQQLATAPSSAPAPVEKIDTSGIHPDRLKAIQSPRDDGTQTTASPTSLPPSGPRSGGHPPSGPSPTTRGPPGVPFPGERSRGDKRFAGLNNMLQQFGAPADKSGMGTSIRGRGANRTGGNSVNAPSPQSTRPQTPVGSKGDNYSGTAPPSGSEKPDLFPSRSDASAPPVVPSQEEPRAHGRAGRRSEIIEEAAAESRRSPRHSSGTRTPDRERDREKDRERERDRERDREHRDRERERDTSRRGEEEASRASTKRDEYRERHREGDRDRDRDRDRGRAADISSREQARGSRESSSRGPPQNSSANREPVSTRRRDKRERDVGTYESQSRGKSDVSPPPPPPPPPPLLASNETENRRWGSGGREEDRNRDRERGRDRERDRDRDRDRERRDLGNGRGGNTGAAGGASGGGNTGGGSWSRKRGRLAGSNVDDGASAAGSSRIGGENKRPRRGH